MARRRRVLTQALTQEIIERRMAAGMIQEDMWRAVGMTKTTYRNAEQGRRGWEFDELVLIAGVLKTSVSDLVLSAEARDPRGFRDEDPGASSWQDAIG